MNTYTSIQNFLNVHISPDLYTLYINDFWLDNTEDKFGSVENKFIVSLLLRASGDKLESLTKNITNNVKINTVKGNLHSCCILATKEELEQILPKLDSYDIEDYSVYYYTVDYKTFARAKLYFSNTLHLDIDENLINCDYTAFVDENLGDVDSFYVVIDCLGEDCLGNDLIENKLIKQKIMEELLGTYCDRFIASSRDHMVLSKNINSKFMDKFNLIKESLDIEVFGLVFGTGYLKTFED